MLTILLVSPLGRKLSRDRSRCGKLRFWYSSEVNVFFFNFQQSICLLKSFSLLPLPETALINVILAIMSTLCRLDSNFYSGHGS